MAKRVLVVEDDTDLRRLYRTILQFGGYEVLEAADGLAALQTIDDHPPDVIVLDLMLPRIDGIVVHQDVKARARTRHIPIVVVTGIEESTDYLDPACVVLRKPVTPEQLVNAVRTCLAESRG